MRAYFKEVSNKNKINLLFYFYYKIQPEHLCYSKVNNEVIKQTSKSIIPFSTKESITRNLCQNYYDKSFAK